MEFVGRPNGCWWSGCDEWGTNVVGSQKVLKFEVNVLPLVENGGHDCDGGSIL